MKIMQAVKLMNIVRIAAVVLIVASAVLYFTAKEYALYPAAAGFALIALINLPLNVWLAFQREKIRKAEMQQYEAGRKGNGDEDIEQTDESIR